MQEIENPLTNPNLSLSLSLSPSLPPSPALSLCQMSVNRDIAQCRLRQAWTHVRVQWIYNNR